MISQIEHVARAFYDAEGNGYSWDNEPEILKDEFRQYALTAIALCNQLQQQRQAEAAESTQAGLPKAA